MPPFILWGGMLFLLKELVAVFSYWKTIGGGYNADVNYKQQTPSAVNFKYFQLIDYNIFLN